VKKHASYLCLVIIAGLVLVSCGNEVPRQVFEPGNGPYLNMMAEDLYFVEDFDNGGNICFLVSEDGVLVVDAGYYPGPTARVDSLINIVTDQPVTKIIYTHCHTDHVGGAAGWPGDAEITAHENLPSNLREFVIPDIDEFRNELAKFGEDSLKTKYGDLFSKKLSMEIRMPDELFQHNKKIKLGEYTVELYYPGPCHTTDNILVYFPDQNLIHTGDLVFNNRHPFISSTYQADAHNWLATLQEWSEKDIQKVIPGHGVPGGMELLNDQAGYLSNLIMAVEEYADSDKEVYEISAEIHSKYFDEYEYSSFFDTAVETVLESINKPND